MPQSLKKILEILGITLERHLIEEEFLQIGLMAIQLLNDQKIGYGDVAEIGKIMKSKFVSEWSNPSAHEFYELFSDMSELVHDLAFNMESFNERSERLNKYLKQHSAMVGHHFIESPPPPVSAFPHKIFNNATSELDIKNDKELLREGTEKVRLLLCIIIESFKKGEMTIDEFSGVGNFLFDQLMTADKSNSEWEELFQLTLSMGELGYYSRAGSNTGQRQFLSFLRDVTEFYKKNFEQGG